MLNLTHRPSLRRPRLALNQGVSLVELLVGVAIGLLVVLAGMGTIVLNRTSSNTISDTAALTSQASNALRQISFVLRQAGALEPSTVPHPTVAGQVQHILAQNSEVQPTTIRCREETGACTTNPETLIISYLNRNPPGATTASEITRDCQGNGVVIPGVPNQGVQINNFFTLAGGELSCRSTWGRDIDTVATRAIPARSISISQPILSNVEAFQVRYLVDDPPNNTTRWQRAPAIQTAGTWNQVVAVEICLQVRGEVNHGNLMTGTYTDCADAIQNHSQFLRMVMRQTVQLRNRGNNL
jgi:type IV pilus assembly protein PilW